MILAGPNRGNRNPPFAFRWVFFLLVFVVVGGLLRWNQLLVEVPFLDSGRVRVKREREGRHRDRAKVVRTHVGAVGDKPDTERFQSS